MQPRTSGTIDDLLDRVMYELGCKLGEGKVGLEDLEGIFVSVLEACFDRRQQLSEEDMARIGDWLHETDTYFESWDFTTTKLVTSKDRARHGKQERKMLEFVEAARAIRGKSLR